MGIIDKASKPFSLIDACLGVNMNDMEQAVNANLRGYVAAARASDAKLYIDARKATGSVPGSNSPFTSPFVDLVGDNDATLTNFAATAADGYTTLPVLSRKGREFTFANLLGADGNFGTDSNADGAGDGWSVGGTVSAQSVLTNVQSVTFSSANSILSHNTETATSGQIYYGIATVNAASTVSIRVKNSGGATVATGDVHSATSGFEKLSVRYTATGSEGMLKLAIQDVATSGWTPCQIKLAHFINLTAMFGAGNEPTKDQMDVIVQKAIATYGYINTRVLKIAWMQFLAADGVDSYGAIADNGSLEFTGTQDFALSGVFVTPPVLQAGFIGITKCNNDANTVQYGFALQSNGSINFAAGGAGAIVGIAPTGSVLPNSINTFMLIRKTGVMKLYVNNIKTYDSANTFSLVSRLFVRLFCRSNSADGSAQTAFFKGFTAICTAHGANVTEASLQAFTDRAFADYLP